MKRLTIFLTVFATCCAMYSQSVKFNFEGTSADMYAFPKQAVEANISRLLTEINRADKANAALDMSAVDMVTEAKKRLNLLWANMHFVCEDDINVEKCQPDEQGFQLRYIPVTVHPLDTAYQGEKYKTLSISLDRKGLITGVRISLDQQNYRKVMKPDHVITDERQRRGILKLIEEYRCYYNAKDIHTLQRFFSSDAVIMQNGSVVLIKGTDTVNQSTTIEYIKRIRHLFEHSRYVDVNFEDIEVRRNPGDGKENWYGVRLKQKLQAGSYSDECYLFLLIEFMDNGEPPVIHVKMLQPAKQPDGTPLKEDEIFDLDCIYIP